MFIGIAKNNYNYIMQAEETCIKRKTQLNMKNKKERRFFFFFFMEAKQKVPYLSLQPWRGRELIEALEQHRVF